MRRIAAVLACLLVPALCAAQGRGGASRPGLTLLQVPYVSQDELLCGGAAATMIMRAGGARGVYASHFATLVDERAGGIRTDDLENAMRERGYDVYAGRGSRELARQRLAARQPVLALIEDRPGRYHYVVIVGWADGAVVYHDPAAAPFMGRREGEFERAWGRANYWMLVVNGAPPVIAEAPAQTSSSDDRLTPASRAFVEGDYGAAARLARSALAQEPNDAESWRLLGASRYLLGDPHGALEAWNRAGGPTVDLVRLEGLRRTPHRAVERLIGLEAGRPLTRETLVRGSRRLTLLPSRQASRLSYVALPDNLAEVRGAVLEREVFPSKTHLVVSALAVPIDREIRASFSNLGASGDRLQVGWRFQPARPGVGVEYAFSAASLPGIWSVSAARQQERYSGDLSEQRREARVGWSQWTTARVRIDAGGSVARYRDQGTFPVLDASMELRPYSEAFSVHVATLGSTGASGFGGVNTEIRWRSRGAPTRWSGGAAWSAVTSRAPRDRWPGAGTGHARPLLLRAHPMIQDDVIGGAVFGRTVAQGTLEVQRDVVTRGLLSVAVATFADTARAWQRTDGSTSPLHVDVGVGLRVRVAAGFPALRLDLARGLRDGEMALSAGLGF